VTIVNRTCKKLCTTTVYTIGVVTTAPARKCVKKNNYDYRIGILSDEKVLYKNKLVQVQDIKYELVRILVHS